MSFFDEGDEPGTRTRARPRRPGGATSMSDTGGGGARPPDHQTLLIRRAVALGVGALLLILVVVLFRGCLDSRAERALRDYNRDVTGIASESEETGAAFFDVLGQGGGEATDQETELNQLRVQAEGQAERARGFDVPDDMANAHRNLLLALDLRSETIRKVARRIGTAREGEDAAAEQATAGIAAQMQALVASDVVYLQRTVPFIREALQDNDIGGQSIFARRFLTNLGWLDPATVADRIGGQGGGGGSGASRGDPAPGLHGHALSTVSVGDTELQPSPAPNRIPAAGNVSFDIAFANQGENDEEDVRVRLRVRGAGRPIEATRTVDLTRQGAEAQVSVPLGRRPPTGTPVTIEVEVVRVPGEEKVDNNRRSYTAIFTR